ncbi:hypothetical protein PV318_04460 [Streptomyces sp. ME02-6991-2B]|nr:hypothetical protein [Streptomyces sp. ME02-6991-2B]
MCGQEELELVGQLVDKSLVVADHDAEEVRYRLLETIHEYAAERAAEDAADRRGGPPAHRVLHGLRPRRR